MVSDYKEILSDSAKGMKRSAIRELLKLTQKPEIISFAGVIILCLTREATYKCGP